MKITITENYLFSGSCEVWRYAFADATISKLLPWGHKEAKVWLRYRVFSAIKKDISIILN